MNELAAVFGILGSLATVAGTAFGIVQRHQRIQADLIRKANVWTSLSKLKALMRNLESDELKMAHQNSLDLFRSLLTEAVLHEPRFTVDTVKRWRKTGRLASDWQERQALLLVDTDALELETISQLPNLDYDQTPRTSIGDRNS